MPTSARDRQGDKTMPSQDSGAACDTGRNPAEAIDVKTPADKDQHDVGAMLAALEAVRSDYAAELRYRRLVAWVACLIVAGLLLGAVVGGYVHRDRVAALESAVTAAQAVADDRAGTIRDLRKQVARAQQAVSAAEGRAAALQQQLHDQDATIAALQTEPARQGQRLKADLRHRE